MSNGAPGASAKNRGTRRVFPFSLIPGGVESWAELKAYSAVDPELDRHYRGLGVLVATTMDRDQRLYASYRMQDAIYWTKNTVLVHAGEHVLTDGTGMVRGRCGNRLSKVRMVPVKQFEPPAVYTERFIPRIVGFPPPEISEPYSPPTLPDFPEVRPPEHSDSTGPKTPPAVPPIVQTTGMPGGFTSVTPPTAVYTPEPETWLLAAAGLASGVLAHALRRRRV